MDGLTSISIDLLCRLIETPSLSREESAAAGLIYEQLNHLGFEPERKGNNVYTRLNVARDLPVILLNSHIDTVKPVAGWTRDPFRAVCEGNRIYGLGSNDAGGALCTLLAVLHHFSISEKQSFNLVYAATAEEEISGSNGITGILEELGPVDLGIIGEPTGMNMAVAEKGLIVFDGSALGRSSHVSHPSAENAIYHALDDINRLRNYQFEKQSEWLGKVSMQVTEIRSGYQHNVIPDQCTYVLDVRTNDCYRNHEVCELIKEQVRGELVPRSLRLNASSIPLDHPIVQKGINEGMGYFGSSTLSDQALLPFPTIKIGPGASERSHTADEFITRQEIEEGIDKYIKLLSGLKI